MSAEVDGKELPKDAYELGEETFTLHKPPSSTFTLKTVVGIEPAKNTQLSGSTKVRETSARSARPRGFGELRTSTTGPTACRPLPVELKPTRRSFPSYYPMVMKSGEVI